MKRTRRKNILLCMSLLLIAITQLSFSYGQTVVRPAPLDSEYNILDVSTLQSNDRLIGATPYPWEAHSYSVRLGLARAVKTDVGVFPVGASWCELTKVGDYAFLGAGHCLYPDEETGEGPLPTTKKLELGVYGGPDDLLQGMVMPRIDSRVECEVHPDYNFTPYFKYYYAGDVLLCRGFSRTPHIDIAPVGGVLKGMLTVVGHGNTVEHKKLLGGATKAFSLTLLGLELPYIENEKFKRDIFPWGFYEPYMFGAGYPDAANVRDTHSGDSGAGLINEDGRLVGIVSHGIDSHGVGVYTRLSESPRWTGVGVDLTRFEHYKLIQGYENTPVQQPELPRRSTQDQTLAVTASPTEEDCECAEFPQRSTRDTGEDGNSLYDFIVGEDGKLVPVEPWVSYNAKQEAIERLLSREVKAEEDCECAEFPQRSNLGELEDGNPYYDFIMDGEGSLIPVEPYARESSNVTVETPRLLEAPNVVHTQLACGEFEPSAIYYGNVTRVIDGDTLVPLIPITHLNIYSVQKLRLFGINAPERKTVTRAAGDAAKLELERLTQDKIIRFEISKADSFGRGLSCMYLGDEEFSINDQMLKNGHAILDLR